MVAWFADALLVNAPAEASNPDPIKAASSEFLMNVSVALLGLAMPIVRDEAKLKKVIRDVAVLFFACVALCWCFFLCVSCMCFSFFFFHVTGNLYQVFICVSSIFLVLKKNV